MFQRPRGQENEKIVFDHTKVNFAFGFLEDKLSELRLLEEKTDQTEKEIEKIEGKMGSLGDIIERITNLKRQKKGKQESGMEVETKKARDIIGEELLNEIEEALNAEEIITEQVDESQEENLENLISLKEAIENDRELFDGNKINSHALEGDVNELVERMENGEDVNVEDYSELVKKALKLLAEKGEDGSEEPEEEPTFVSILMKDKGKGETPENVENEIKELNTSFTEKCAERRDLLEQFYDPENTEVTQVEINNVNSEVRELHKKLAGLGLDGLSDKEMGYINMIGEKIDKEELNERVVEIGETPEEIIETSIIFLAEDLGVELDEKEKSDVEKLERIKNGELEVNAENVGEIDNFIRNFFAEHLENQSLAGEEKLEEKGRILREKRNLYNKVMAWFTKRRAELERGAKKPETKQEIEETLEDEKGREEIENQITEARRGAEALKDVIDEKIEEQKPTIPEILEEDMTSEDQARKGVPNFNDKQDSFKETEEPTKPEKPIEKTPEPEPEIERREAPESLRESLKEVEKARNDLLVKLKEENKNIKEKIMRGEEPSKEEIAENNRTRFWADRFGADVQIIRVAVAGYSEPKEECRQVESAAKAQEVILKDFETVTFASAEKAEKSFDEKLKTESPEIQGETEKYAEASSKKITAKIGKFFSSLTKEKRMANKTLEEIGNVETTEELSGMIGKIIEKAEQKKNLKPETLVFLRRIKKRNLDHSLESVGGKLSPDEMRKELDSEVNKEISGRWKGIIGELLTRIEEVGVNVEAEKEIDKWINESGLEEEVKNINLESLDEVIGSLKEGLKERSEKMPGKIRDFFDKIINLEGIKGGLNWYIYALGAGVESQDNKVKKEFESFLGDDRKRIKNLDEGSGFKNFMTRLIDEIEKLGIEKFGKWNETEEEDLGDEKMEGETTTEASAVKMSESVLFEDVNKNILLGEIKEKLKKLDRSNLNLLSEILRDKNEERKMDEIIKDKKEFFNRYISPDGILGIGRKLKYSEIKNLTVGEIKKILNDIQKE